MFFLPQFLTLALPAPLMNVISVVDSRPFLPHDIHLALLISPISPFTDPLAFICLFLRPPCVPFGTQMAAQLSCPLGRRWIGNLCNRCREPKYLRPRCYRRDTRAYRCTKRTRGRSYCRRASLCHQAGSEEGLNARGASWGRHIREAPHFS